MSKKKKDHRKHENEKDESILNEKNENKESKEYKYREELQSLKEKMEDERSAFLSKAAEFDNIRKRLEKESKDQIKFSNERMVVKFLDVIDNLELAILSSEKSGDFKSLDQGVKMIAKQFRSLLDMEGVKSMEAKGKEFDPNLHHAISSEESKDGSGKVLEEIRKGYTLNGKVIRPALVKVSK